MYFHSVHGKNISLSADSSQARRESGFCHGITFSNNPLVQFQRVTFLVGSELTNDDSSKEKAQSQNEQLNFLLSNLNKPIAFGNKRSFKKSLWNGCLRIGLTTKNPSTLTSSDLPEFSYPTLLNTDGFWITCIKSSYLKHGNRLSLVLDKNNSIQLEVNYVVKANLFGNNSILNSITSSKLWLVLDLYGSTNMVKFLPSDDTPYEIRARGLDAVNNFHTACTSGGSKPIYKTRLILIGPESSTRSIFSPIHSSLIKNTSTQKRLKMPSWSSFRVNVDNVTKYWNFKQLANKGETRKQREQQHNNELNESNDENKESPRNRFGDECKSKNYDSLNKRRSSSVSYLNEDDDYDETNYHSKSSLKYPNTYKRNLSLSEQKICADELRAAEFNPSQNKSRQQRRNSFELLNKESSELSSSSSNEDSNLSDSDTNEDLYAIDETQESIENLFDDPTQFKKDPTGYYYRRIALNIYKELFVKKMYDKLWPSSSKGSSELSATNSEENSPAKNALLNESLFTNLALSEFESSVYAKLKCSKVLFYFYEQIVVKQKNLLWSLNNKKNFLTSNTIVVTPSMKNLKEPDSDGQEANVDSANSINKKLSFTISFFDGQLHQIFLSSRAVYLICFDLSKDLDEIAQLKLEYEIENTELTHLEYLDFWMRSIHAHTGKIISSLDGNESHLTHDNVSKANEFKDDASYLKNAMLSPPIIIVGTHKNKLNHLPNKQEVIRQKFDKIKDLISKSVYAKHVVDIYYSVETLDEVDHGEPTDNLTNVNKDKTESDLENLKRAIEKIALNEPYMGEQQPLRWTQFAKSLEKLKSKGLFYASLSQICELAHEIGINTQEELTTCLNFYHDLGVIIYYSTANDIFLRNTIILRPQKLIDIFNLILFAEMPTSFTKLKSSNSDSYLNPSFRSQTNWMQLWQNFDKHGILDDSLLDVLWKGVSQQKPGLLGLMKKFDLICERRVNSRLKGKNAIEYLVPCRASMKIDETMMKTSRSNPTSDVSFYNSEDSEIEDLSEYYKTTLAPRFADTSIVEFYYHFGSFFPESLFHRIVTRTARWTYIKNGADSETSVRLFYRKAIFYLDNNHEFTLEMFPLKYSLLKIKVTRLDQNQHGFVNEKSSPEPNACAKVRNFIESTLLDFKNLWMKRLIFKACVQCMCKKLCETHQANMCNKPKCIHFLNLDECLTNNIVYCDYQRVKTYLYKSWFPTQNTSLHKGPVLAAMKNISDKNMFYDENTLPNWIKNVAKLLQTSIKDTNKDQVQVAKENDWIALGHLLGYSKSKINCFNESKNPALQLICDWIMSSDNTNLTIEYLLNYLEQMERDDVIKIINSEREKETVNSSIFISYQQDSQEDVIKIKSHLEKAGFNCFMDVGQISGGNNLYQKIDQAIRNAKVVVACVTPKFVVSHFCNREMALADLLQKPIVPIMIKSTPWPPPGGMSLIFSQLVYVDYCGIGSHGGCGLNADRDQRNNEIVAIVARHVDPSSYFLMNIDSMTDEQQTGDSKSKKKMILESLNPTNIIRSSSGIYSENHRLDEQNSPNNMNFNNSANTRRIVTPRSEMRAYQRSRGDDLAPNQATVSKCYICNIL